MRQGDFAAAWRMSDAVLAARDPAGRDDPARPYHERWVWDGWPLDGQDVTVRCYHGLGDTIQFARFLPALARRAARVTLEVQPELLRLLSAQALGIRLVPFDQAHPLAADVDLEVMELCHALRLPPSPAPYWHIEAAGPPGVGVCWQAGGWDPARSIPPDMLAPVLPPDTVSLVPGATACGWPAAIPAGADVLDTAGIIAGLDLVVTVDTMVAHLAGALGRPTVLLLKADADWRWGTGSQTPWYGSIHALRQPAPGGWGALLGDLAEACHRARPTV